MSKSIYTIRVCFEISGWLFVIAGEAVSAYGNTTACEPAMTLTCEEPPNTAQKRPGEKNAT